MNSILKISNRALIAGLVFTSSIVAAEAADSVRTYKPFAAISFSAGVKHGVGYFYPNAANCRLVLTIADEPNFSAAHDFTAMRHEEDVPAGSATRYNTTQGRAVEFSCLAGADAMSVREVERLAGRTRN